MESWYSSVRDRVAKGPSLSTSISNLRSGGRRFSGAIRGTVPSIRSSCCSFPVTGGGVIIANSGAGGEAPAPPYANEWEMFQYGKYNLDIIDMLNGHQTYQFKGLGLERQLQHQQQVQLHQQQLQQQQQAETSGALLSGLGTLQGIRGNTFSDSASVFSKMSAPPTTLPQQTPASTSSQSSRKSSKQSVSAGLSGSSTTGYTQFLRSFHPTEAALAQEQLHSVGRFEHFTSGSGSSGAAGGIGGLVTPAPPPPPLHPGLSVPQPSVGPSSASPSSSASTSNASSSTVTSLGHQLVGAQSDARLHQQFSCMLAANQYFLSGVPANSSLEQFLVQQGTHNHLSLGLGQAPGDSGLGPPPALHPSHPHSHTNPQQPQQQQPPHQQLPPHTLSHTHSHPHPPHPLHPTPQPTTLGSFEFQGIPVLSSNQLASLMQQESPLALPLPLLTLSKDDGKGDSGNVGGRRKKAMVGYLPQKKMENSGGNGETNPSSSSGRHDRDSASGLSSISGDTSSLLSSSSCITSSSSVPSSSLASVLVTNGSQPSKPDNPGTDTGSQPEQEPLYHCGECGKTFTHLTSLRRHLRSHVLVSSVSGNRNSSNKTSSNPSNNPLQSDVSLPHSTQECNLHHQSQQQLSLNMQQSNQAPTSSSCCPCPEREHRCIECGKGFKKKGHLVQHGVIHSGARPYACQICQRAFNRRESLTRHEKIHQDKPYRCPACGRCFRESTSLLNHAAAGTCGKPGRGPRPRPTTSGGNPLLGHDAHYSHKCSKTGSLGADGTISGEGGVVQYHGGPIGGGGVLYGKTETDDEDEEEVRLIAEGERSGKTVLPSQDKYPADFSRSHQTPYRRDDYRGGLHRSQMNSCYSGHPACGSGIMGQGLRKMPLAPTLHPHSQAPQPPHPHLPLSSLLEDSEDDVTSSVNSAISAIAAAAAASCMPGEVSPAVRVEERRDIIGGLLGGLGLGSLSSGSTPGMEKDYRGGGITSQDGMVGTVTTSHNQPQHPQHTGPIKPKKPRKPRQKKELVIGVGGEVIKRRLNPQGETGREGNERMFLCSVCGRGFTRRETLRRHDRIHTGEKPHHCSVCGKNFREAFHLAKHHTVHSGEKNYKCHLCGKDFGYAQSLKRHGKLHRRGELGDVTLTTGGNNGKNSSIATLGRSQGSTDSYYSYSDIKLQGPNAQPPPKLYTCTVCWKSFHHHFHLTAHHQAVHEDGGRLYTCEVCGKAFAYANSLSRHRHSQHGLSRTGQTNQPVNVGVSGTNDSTSVSLSESEVATNTLLQLVPPSGSHGIQQGHSTISHSLQPPQQSPSFSPLFYLPDLAPPPPTASSAPTYTPPLPHNANLTPLSNHLQSSTVKGEPLYSSGSSNPVTTTSAYPLLVASTSHTSQQQPHHHHHHHPLPHSVSVHASAHQHHFQSRKDLKKRLKKKKEKKISRDTLSLVSDSSRHVSVAEMQRAKRKKRHKKRRRRFFQLRWKKRVTKLLKLKYGGSGRVRAGIARVNFERLSSLNIVLKRFPCVLCPRATFSRQAALIVHRVVRHPIRVRWSKSRCDCPVCGKRSRNFLLALCHRGTHLARRTFSCPRCPLSFWNETLLKRHKLACQGGRKGRGRVSSARRGTV